MKLTKDRQIHIENVITQLAESKGMPEAELRYEMQFALEYAWETTRCGGIFNNKPTVEEFLNSTLGLLEIW